MSEDNGKQAMVVTGASVFRGAVDRGDGHGKGEGSGELAEAPTSRRAASIPDPEVAAHPTRRRFSAAYKARVVEEAEACTEAGEVGALLRREGLYSGSSGCSVHLNR